MFNVGDKVFNSLSSWNGVIESIDSSGSYIVRWSDGQYAGMATSNSLDYMTKYFIVTETAPGEAQNVKILQEAPLNPDFINPDGSFNSFVDEQTVSIPERAVDVDMPVTVQIFEHPVAPETKFIAIDESESPTAMPTSWNLEPLGSAQPEVADEVAVVKTDAVKPSISPWLIFAGLLTAAAIFSGNK